MNERQQNRRRGKSAQRKQLGNKVRVRQRKGQKNKR